MSEARVLVVNMNYLGDALMTTPALAMLHRAYGGPVDVIAGGASGYGAIEVLRENPDVRNLISRVDGGATARCKQLFDLIRGGGGYDIVVVLPSIPAYRWTAVTAGAKNVVYVPPAPEREHMAEHMLNVVAARLGLKAGPMQMVLRVGEASRQVADQLLSSVPKGMPLIGLNVGASRPQKRWPEKAFQELSRRLRTRGYATVLLGGPHDKAIASRISGDDSAPRALDLTGQTTISDLCAVIERCAAVVTGDTGAMHIAAALEIPVVALFGSTDPALTSPIGFGRSQVIYKELHCAPCKNHPTCKGAFDCMSSITAVEVAAAVDQLAERAVERPRLKIVTS